MSFHGTGTAYLLHDILLTHSVVDPLVLLASVRIGDRVVFAIPVHWILYDITALEKPHIVDAIREIMRQGWNPWIRVDSEKPRFLAFRLVRDRLGHQVGHGILLDILAWFGSRHLSFGWS